MELTHVAITLMGRYLKIKLKTLYFMSIFHLSYIGGVNGGQVDKLQGGGLLYNITNPNQWNKIHLWSVICAAFFFPFFKSNKNLYYKVCQTVHENGKVFVPNDFLNEKSHAFLYIILYLHQQKQNFWWNFFIAWKASSPVSNVWDGLALPAHSTSKSPWTTQTSSL